MVEQTLNATKDTIKLELIQQEEVTPEKTKLTYHIRKDGDYVSGSLCYSEDEAKTLFKKMILNDGVLVKNTVILSETIKKGGKDAK